MAGRIAKPKPTKTLEQRLWDAADKLRGNQEPSEYKHVVLGLVFLKYISDRFEERRGSLEAELLADGIKPERIASFLEDRDEYTSQNVFWENARWGYVQSRAKLTTVGQDIDSAMDLIEKENPSVRGVLPRNYAQELVTAVRASATTNWNLKDSVRAAMRTKVRRLLAKYDYPPDAEPKAIELVLEQAEVLAGSEVQR